MSKPWSAAPHLLQSRPRTIFFVFALGIVIPSGFLSYLGFRSYQYESALLERETHERYESLAEVLRAKADTAIQGQVTALRELASQGKVAQSSSLSGTVFSLGLMSSLNGLPIDYVAFFDLQEAMIFPVPTHVLSPSVPVEPQWGVYDDELRRLEKLEYASHETEKALAGYQSLLGRRLSSSQRIALLFSVGGAAMRIQKYGVAEDAYATLVEHFDLDRIPNGLPVGLVASEQLAKVFDAVGPRVKRYTVALDIDQGLLTGRWGPLPTQDALLKAWSPTLVMQAASSEQVPVLLRHRAGQLALLAKRLETARAQTPNFLQQDWPEALRALHRRGWVEQGGVVRLRTLAGERSLIATPVLQSAGDRRVGLLIVLLDTQPLRRQLLAELAEIAQPEKLRIILGERKPTLLSGFHPVISKVVEAEEPPETLWLYESSSSERDRVSRHRLLIYGGMVGLSLFVIVIGLWTMNRAVRREVEVAKLKSDFVANVSHELRTPLSAIAYIADRLNRGRYRGEQEMKKLFGMLGKEAARLQELIEDVLDFSKMLNGKKRYTISNISLGEVAREAVDRVRGKADAGGFHFKMDIQDPSPMISGDARAIVQAIVNLLENAMKYSGQARQIGVVVRSDAETERVEVLDQGIGIPSEERERIFEKFYRVEEGAERDIQSGVGLGLALVRSIMQSHLGRIEVESEVGRGSLFRLRFPCLPGDRGA